MADEKVKKKEAKQPSKVGRWFKDFFSELKKVTWPTFANVLKQTGIVLLVTVCFLVVMILFDLLFNFLYDLLLSGLTEETVTAALSAAMRGVGGLL